MCSFRAQETTRETCKREEAELTAVAHTPHPSAQEAEEAELCEFKANLDNT